MGYSGSWLTAVALAGLATLGATHVKAADYLNFPVESAPAFAIKPVELGSGWYLRGGLGASNDKGPLLVPEAPSARHVDWAIDVGAGYKFNNWLRSDATLSFNKPRDISRNGLTVTCPYGLTQILDSSSKELIGYLWDTGPNARETCTPQSKSELRKTDLMLNAYVDLGSWGGMTPFVGVGAGISMLKTSASETFFKTSDGSVYGPDLSTSGAPYKYPWVDSQGRPIGTVVPWTDGAGQTHTTIPPVFFEKQNWNRNASKTSYNLAWSLMGGVAYDITPQLKAELGYRYLNSGSFTSLSSPIVGAVKSKIDSHQMKIGFRYMID